MSYEIDLKRNMLITNTAEEAVELILLLVKRKIASSVCAGLTEDTMGAFSAPLKVPAPTNGKSADTASNNPVFAPKGSVSNRARVGINKFKKSLFVGDVYVKKTGGSLGRVIRISKLTEDGVVPEVVMSGGKSYSVIRIISYHSFRGGYVKKEDYVERVPPVIEPAEPAEPAAS